MQREWKQAGEVYVDSGSVMITDPCYVLPDKRDNDPGLDYMRAVSLDDEDGANTKFYKRSKRWKGGDLTALQLPSPDKYRNGGSVESFNDSEDTLVGSFLLDSGYGDGAYPLYVLIDEDERIVGAFIDFGEGFDPTEFPTQGVDSEDWSDES